jgi:hypothetical protein
MLGLLTLLKLVPLKAWLWLAAAAAVAVLAWRVDANIRADERGKVNAVWQKRQAEAEKAYQEQIAHLRGEIADWVLKGLADRDAAAAALRTEMARHDQTFEQLKQRSAAYVTPEAVRRCDLTRGVILQFQSGAARANGEADPSPAAEPGAAAVDAPSEVPLDRYTAAVTETQSALGACRVTVVGWQKHWDLVTRWYEGLREKVNECIPSLKESSP